MKKFILNHWELILLIVLGLLLVWPLFVSGYFSHQDDLQVIRIFEMGKCYMDLQIPCRWSPDLAYGYGYPLFNFYNPFPYYLGALAIPLLGYIGSAKLLFFIPLFFSGMTMFIFASSIMNKRSALLTAILYEFAPYRSVDGYVRGAIGESFAILIVPLVLYFTLALVRKRTIKNLVGVSITLAIFLTSHNVSVVMWIPFMGLWYLMILFINKWQNFTALLISTLVGIGLSAFFILPAFIEKNLVTTSNLISGSLDFRNNFISYKDLFLRSWGYGASNLGPNMGLSFQIGWPHWILAASFPLLLLIFRKKIKKAELFFGIYFLLVFVGAIFMTHNISTPIWLGLGVLKFVQFPWRFISIVIFGASVLGGLFINYFENKLSKVLFLLISLITILLNWNYFRPNKFYFDITDSKKLGGNEFSEQIQGASLDYLPLTAKAPVNLNDGFVKLTNGNKLTMLNKKSGSWSFEADLPKESEVTVPVFYFPNWQVKVNGTIVKTDYDLNGLIKISLKGASRVEGSFKDTNIRFLSNIVSLFSALILAIMVIYEKNKKFSSN